MNKFLSFFAKIIKNYYEIFLQKFLDFIYLLNKPFTIPTEDQQIYVKPC